MFTGCPHYCLYWFITDRKKGYGCKRYYSEKFILVNQTNELFTIKPVYKGNSRELVIVSFMSSAVVLYIQVKIICTIN